MSLTTSERDSTNQLIGSIDDVISVVDKLVKGTINWEGASAPENNLKPYSGVQDVEEKAATEVKAE